MNMFKELFEKFFSFMTKEDEGITADIAKENNQAYLNSLRAKQRIYIKQLCLDINNKSKEGAQRIYTRSNTECSFMTKEFMTEIKEYFEKRGFTVEKRDDGYNEEYWFVISW